MCFSESEIEEFTSLSSASIHLLLHFSSLTACHVSYSFAVSFGRSNRSNFVASHLPFGRISRPSVAARIQCPCKANGGPGTAVNYPLYTALALEPILNDPSNFAGEREKGTVEEERWVKCISRPCAKEHRKFTGPRRSRDDVSDDDEEDGIENEDATRDGNQENLFGNHV